MSNELREFPEYADIFTLKEFSEDCKAGFFVNDDGTGYYATAEGISKYPARPSDLANGIVMEGYNYIAWFNK